ncbi:hypothetical protein [Elizabethkingia anophelis]|uniref:Uncharacterized protein n=1 Tax=Elizabethkingia anophelis TaxID=1117645 RepID=A0A455ZHW2_9FLAO|nr:hypothetical protein [Elizabethkingia anophelis]AQW92987.1 hypothetical protein BBD30_01690 [Elizabethkingia anophelis]OPB61047.1 hypothetical protein BAS07_01120 [Elizabethkingia anophelis]DAC76447.1 TPA_exp: hypothetical protein [Elizabethkingia anophelis]
MEKLLIIPENKRQLDLLKSLLKEMKIKFVPTSVEDDTKMSKEEYYSKLDNAKKGKKTLITPELRKQLFES